MQLKIHNILFQCICLCSLFTFGSSKALVGDNIRQVKEKEFPFVVSVGMINPMHESDYQHMCSGSLISKQDILTASHCIKNTTKELTRVSVGSTNHMRGKRYKVLGWIDWEEWARENNATLQSLDNDIAIIRINGTVDKIEPATLAKFKTKKLVGYNVIVLGWGRGLELPAPLILEAADLTVMDREDCLRRMISVQRAPLILEETFFCTATDPFILVVNGDSGGPVVYKNAVVGLTVASCPLPTTPIHPGKVNVHHDIFYYRRFINSVIAGPLT